MRFELGVLRKAQNSGSNCRNAAIAHPRYGYRLYTSLEAKEIVLKSGKTSTVQEKNRTGFS
jgi:hypothetical protein